MSTDTVPISRSAAIIAGLVLVVACSTGDGSGDAERPGDADVYAQIEAENDCTWLQERFDRAAEAHERALARDRSDLAEIDTAYMDAIDDRMREIGCYD